MRPKFAAYFLLGISCLSACGGGSDKNKGESITPSTPSAPLTPEVVLSISKADYIIELSEGDTKDIQIEGSWTGTNLAGNSVYLKISDTNNNIIASSIQDVSETITFSLATSISSSLDAGHYDSELTLLACMDSECQNEYTSSTAKINVKLTVLEIPEWQTHQGNASHNGYVPVNLTSNNVQKLWEWAGVVNETDEREINPPVAGDNVVYVSTKSYFSDAVLIAFDETNGDRLWQVDYINYPALNPPAINDEKVFIATSGHENTKLWGIERTNGQISFQVGFSSQWGSYLAPTPFEDIVYQTGGYYGGSTYAYSIADGSPVWEQVSGASWGKDTAAVDQENIYVYDNDQLTVITKENGEIKSTISDPNDEIGNDHEGSVVIGSNGRVLSFSGNDAWGDRHITSFDVANESIAWRSESKYSTTFAVANGVVYAGRNDSVALEALDESTGEKLWSWTSQSTEDTAFEHNVIVTNNLVFVSTNVNVYAIDLTTREVIWSHNDPGLLALSDNRRLIITTELEYNQDKITVFDFK